MQHLSISETTGCPQHSSELNSSNSSPSFWEIKNNWEIKNIFKRDIQMSFIRCMLCRKAKTKQESTHQNLDMMCMQTNWNTRQLFTGIQHWLVQTKKAAQSYSLLKGINSYERWKQLTFCNSHLIFCQSKKDQGSAELSSCLWHCWGSDDKRVSRAHLNAATCPCKDAHFAIL